MHLHNHTQYSLLDGLTKVPALIQKIKSSGMDAVAITDHGTLSGVIEFYKEARAEGIKPIIGIEAYMAPRTHKDKEVTYDKEYFHIIILAMNNQGYKNLMRLSTIANLEGYYYKPRIDRQLLEKYNEGLIVLSGCISGEFASSLRNGSIDQARDIAKWYQKVFGDRYYIEIQDHGHFQHPSVWKEQTDVNDKAFEIAEQLKIKTVITGDAHYLNIEDQEAHEILLCVQTGSFLSDTDRMSLKDFHLHVAEPEEIISRWGKDHAESILCSKEIADRCDVTIELGKILIPKFPLPAGQTEKSYLEKLVYSGLAWRFAALSKEKATQLNKQQAKKLLSGEVLERAEFELSVIEKMGFSGYMLIIHDFVSWGKGRGIIFGPGRGSAAGSIISYALGITDINPLQYGLLFERFLNPDRISMPDIDIDIQDSRRDEVIQYCVDKYGKDRVANIVTFGRMAARNAVRDVARVLEVPYAESDRLAKMIPPPVQGRHILLEKSIVDDIELRHEYESSERTKEVFDLAIKLEGTIRSHGVHAAGVVIAPEDIVEYTPLEMAQKGVVATQYSMGPIEEIGLLKMDFLGLSNLTIINNALRIIKKVYGKSIDINKIEMDDKKTYELLKRGDTAGVFQLESAGMRRYLKDLKPTVFDDIIAMVALYRPGPLGAGLTDSYIKRKNGIEKTSFIHEKTRESLKSTYGVLVYQEQVMQISKDLCGFSGGQADTLRKAIGKKIKSVMVKMEKEFIEGALSNSDIGKGVIEKFWVDLLGFADYCFNKSHAASYGMISYWTAYLKAHYPAAFMASLMTSSYDDTDKLAGYISDSKEHGIEVLPPDVNESFAEFGVVKKDDKEAIRFGMNAIKNVGQSASEEIVRARSEAKFSSLEDFLTRVNSKSVNKKAIESLVKSGAFDSFGDRGVLSGNIDTLVVFSQKAQRDLDSGQIGLFGTTGSQDIASVHAITLNDPVTKHSTRQQLIWERELLGIFLSSHPLDDYREFLLEQAVPLENIKHDHHNKSVRVGGNIDSFKEVITKKGQKMVFVELGDKTSNVELIVFPGAYQKTLGIWEKDKVVLVDGKVSGFDQNDQKSDIKILVDDVREITHEQAINYQKTGKALKTPKVSVRKSKSGVSSKAPNDKLADQRIYIKIKDTNDIEALAQLKKNIDKSPGQIEVVLVVGDGGSRQIIKLPGKVEPTDGLISESQALFGIENVVFK
ncbi:DNA polymerase III subunit alpha [Candidatus Saccharibacteria bacterium RIFCSPHIGHO2_12_FULL_41_12]|nr:MAG: DNA polymerase III subunit alpha [Candidatus Saccharibacteria bacterium RIFCSPHIGHO2_12_FULL_41_12]